MTQSIKRIILKKNGVLTKEDIIKITNNIVGFDINPISVVSAKANYILIMFSAFFDNCDEEFGNPVSIPVFIADSILSPVVYTEENGDTLKLTTSVGELELPKFESFKKGNEFLKQLSYFIHEKPKYEVFKNLMLGKNLIKEEDLPEGDEINMCKAMDQLFQRMRDEGELNTLKELLKVKLGTLSIFLEKQLTNTSLEKT